MWESSIHPWRQSKQKCPDLLLLGYIIQLFWVGTKAFPRRSQGVLGPSRPTPSRTCPKYPALNILLRRHPEGIVKGLNHLVWLLLMWKNTGSIFSPSSMTRGTVPNFNVKLRRHVNQDSPTASRALKNSHPHAAQSDGQVITFVPRLCFHYGRRGSRIEEILEV